jgi:predicted GIY-YIG superfamily endonuclease
MFHVYILNSLVNRDRMYVGRTQNIEHRLAEHNAGECVHTNKYKPWVLCTYITFDSQEKAVAFERYLKSGSGRAFARKRL